MFENIINYWIDIEANVPPLVDTSKQYVKTQYNVNQLITEISPNMNWETHPDMRHKVYLGIFSVSSLFQRWLKKGSEIEVDYDSYILSFDVEDGYPVLNSLFIPQYIVSMYHHLRDEKGFFDKKDSEYTHYITDQFSQWIDILKSRSLKVDYSDFAKFLEVIIKNVSMFDMENVDHMAYIESIPESAKSFPSEAMDSFYVEDFKKILNSMTKKEFGKKSALEYVLKKELKTLTRYETSNSEANIKKLINPMMSNIAAWPGDGAYPLVTAQQVATNIIFSKLKDVQSVFSVNGPPGTGKTTLLQSVIANIIYQRSVEINKKMSSGKPLFYKEGVVRVDNEDIDVYAPAKSITGFEIVIASSNNSAVKNITEELPLLGSIDSRVLDKNEYFSEVSDQLLGQETWGLIATALGNSKNNEKVTRALKEHMVDQIKTVDICKKEYKFITKEMNEKVSLLTAVNQKIADGTLTDNEKAALEDAVIHKNFWLQDIEDIHKASPHNNVSLNIMKGKIFMSAMKLHKAMISENKEVFVNMIKLMPLLLKGKIKDKKLAKNIWQTYFLMVPVVSSTFASYQRLFRDIEESELGYLMIDEAGQAMGHVMMGALWRTKIAIVVGDPLQIPPVTSISENVNLIFKEKNKVEGIWDPVAYSAQEIADIVNPYGTYLMVSGKKDPLWVGSPLLVHRRSDNPMFDVSNAIAYDNKMIHAKPDHKPGNIAKIIGKSQWFDVSTEHSLDSHWEPKQYDLFQSLLAKYMTEMALEDVFDLPNLYVISPFKEVAFKLKAELMKNKKEWLPKEMWSIDYKELKAWMDNSIGTVHTFQGKEAEAVFVVLGGHSKVKGAIKWATQEPNLVNVACTRAKNAQYFIGDKELWNIGVFKDVIKIFDKYEK